MNDLSNVGTIAKRELAALFFSPIGYVVMAVFLLFLGFFFVFFSFVPGRYTEMRDTFIYSRIALIFVVPLITMSLFSDEYRSGRIEMLRTSPLTEASLLLGKFFGAFGFYCAIYALTLVYLVLLMIFGGPDYHVIFTSYVGALLMGMMFVSIGLFFSACTENQIVAAMSGILTLFALTIVAGFVGQFLPPTFRRVTDYMAVQNHLEDFAKGIIDTAHVVYFLTSTALFLFLTYLLLESRKWR